MAMEIWQADPARSEIAFRLRHIVLAAIAGRARGWEATLRIDRDEPARSTIDVAIDAARLDTGDPERDGHLRSSEFLNAGAHPRIRFNSTEVIPEGNNRYLVRGLLTILGIAREVVLEVEDLDRSTNVDGARRAAFNAHTTFDRQAFGLRWNQDLDTGGVVVGDKVDVSVKLEAVLLTPSAPPRESR